MASPTKLSHDSVRNQERLCIAWVGSASRAHFNDRLQEAHFAFRTLSSATTTTMDARIVTVCCLAFVAVCVSAHRPSPGSSESDSQERSRYTHFTGCHLALSMHGLLLFTLEVSKTCRHMPCRFRQFGSVGCEQRNSWLIAQVFDLYYACDPILSRTAHS